MGWFWADAEPSAPVAPHTLPKTDAAPPPGCPMHGKMPSSKPSIPVPSPPAAVSQASSSASACPYNPPTSSDEKSTTSSTFSKLNPLNYMPKSIANSRINPDQAIMLELDREASTIPRGDGSGTNWEYPSPQQMYNAMLRKGYTDTPAQDVPAMVAVHNFLNEGAWAEIVDWESRFSGGLARGWEISKKGEENAALVAEILARREKITAGAKAEEEAKQPALVRFMGRPNDPTPRARMFAFLGWLWPSQFESNPPFDRHDWFVRRHTPDGGEKEVRYVIDYYSAPEDENGEPVFFLDVRPAIDGPTAACERMLRWGGDVWWRASGGSVREELSKLKK